jgi:hypothetical protein
MLGVAIAATLSLPVGVVYAGTFQNVNCTDTTASLTGCTTNPQTATNFDLGATSLIEVPTGGTVYALELFGGETSPPALPKTKKAAVLYTIDGGVSADFDLIFTLSEGLFAVADPQLGIWDAAGQYTTPIGMKKGGKGVNSAEFNLTASTKPLDDGDRLIFVYQFDNTSSLANQDESGKVELSVSLLDDTGIPVNSPDKVTIATSKQAVQVNLKPETEGSVKISVADDSKTFATGTNPAYQSATVAQIGYIEVTNVNASITDSKMKIKESDGETTFLIGQGSDGKVNLGAKNDDGSKQGSWLEITGGQFAASKTGDGKVLINSSEEISVQAEEDGTTAFFGLTDTNLQNIADELPADQATPVGIRMQVDDSTPINTVENPPEANLAIDFVESYVKDITGVSSQLLQIHKDGTVCVVYNLAGPDTQDRFSIRITNTSSVPGKLSGKLYGTAGDDNGVLLASGNLNGGQVIQPWETVVFHSGNAGDTLNADGFTWEGRAMLEITSTLPNIEVMALSRHMNPGSPLSDISTGAMGDACSSQ